MRDLGSSLFAQIKMLFSFALVVLILSCVFFRILPFVEEGYRQLPKLLQLPFDLFWELFAPENKMAIAGVAQESGGIHAAWVALALAAGFIVFLLTRLIFPKSGSSDEDGL